MYDNKVYQMFRECISSVKINHSVGRFIQGNKMNVRTNMCSRSESQNADQERKSRR